MDTLTTDSLHRTRSPAAAHGTWRQWLAWCAIAALLAAGALLGGCNGSEAAAASQPSPPPSQGSPQPIYVGQGPRTLDSLSPSMANAGSADLPVTLTGENFRLDSFHFGTKVFWSRDGEISLLAGSSEASSDSSTELHVLIPASLLATPGTATIYIGVWDPMGDNGYPTVAGYKQGLPFTVTPAPAAAAAATPAGSSNIAAMDAVGSAASGAQYLKLDVPGSTDTRAFGINSLGEIVGRYDDARGVTHGFLRRANGSYYRFSAPKAVNGTWAQDISDDGVIVGRYFDAGFGSHGFVLDHGQFRDVEYPGAMETTVRGISAERRLTGYYLDSAGFETGFIRDRDGFRSVLYPNSDSTDVWDTAPDGTMVGDWSDAENNIYGYSLRHGQFRDLNVPAAATVTSIRGINADDTMVGVFDDVGGALHGFVRTPAGRYIRLDVPGAADTIANRINKDGSVVGFYDTASGRTHGFIATGWARGAAIATD